MDINDLPDNELKEIADELWNEYQIEERSDTRFYLG